MRGSSLTTFLMFLPLIAIPLLAIFGVPEFTPVNASTPADPGGTAILLDGPVRKGNPERPAGNDSLRNNDVFAPVHNEPAAAPGFPSQGLKPEADPFLNERRGDGDRNSGQRGLNGWEIDQERRRDERSTRRVETSIKDERTKPVAVPSGNAAAMQSVGSMPETPRPAFTWRKAVQTLNRMGITDFLLQPGSRSEEFHFSCVFPSSDNPRIAHRFEAEDADPLRAVQKVLQQIQSRQ
jgi:hypothetical protein